MRIDAFLNESPMFAVNRAARRFESLAAQVFAADHLNFLEGLVLQRKIDPEDARAYQLTLKPLGKKCAVRVIGAFDKLQKEFEQEIGKTALGEMLKVLRKLEALCAQRHIASR